MITVAILAACSVPVYAQSGEKNEQPTTPQTASPTPQASQTPAPVEAVPPPAPARPPVPAKQRVVVKAGANTGDFWYRLRLCESGNDYAKNTGNGYYGAYQFNQSTFTANGGSGRPDLASPASQDAAAQRLYNARGISPWPTCGKKAQS